MEREHMERSSGRARIVYVSPRLSAGRKGLQRLLAMHSSRIGSVAMRASIGAMNAAIAEGTVIMDPLFPPLSAASGPIHTIPESRRSMLTTIAPSVSRAAKRNVELNGSVKSRMRLGGTHGDTSSFQHVSSSNSSGCTEVRPFSRAAHLQ